MSVDTEFVYEYSSPFKIPAFCYQHISSKNSKLEIDKYKQILTITGLLLIKLDYDDNDGSTMEDIVNQLGKAHTHNASGLALWDIKSGGSNGNESLARSHKLSEFVLHTDCSYETKIPDFFGLYVVQHDELGGGKNLLVDCLTLINHLSKSSLKILQTEKVKIIVPAEFKKDVDYIYETIIDADFNVRYRKEILDLTDVSGEMMVALDEFERLSNSPVINRAVEIKKNTILLLDNKRYLHARTTIKDNKRHLKRIRFFADFHKV